MRELRPRGGNEDPALHQLVGGGMNIQAVVAVVPSIPCSYRNEDRSVHNRWL